VNLEEQNDFTSVVPVIDDGDPCCNAEHKATAQALANRTKYLRERADPLYDLATGAKTSAMVALSSITGDTADVPFPNEETPFNALNPPGVMGRGLARWIKAAHNAILGIRPGNTAVWFLPTQGLAPANATWAIITDGSLGPSLAQISSTPTPLYLGIPLPGITGLIKEIGAYVTGGAGHSGLPATMPRLRLIRTSISGGTTTHNELAGVNDPSASLGAYQQQHTIVLTGLTVPVTPPAPSAWTYLNFTGETGANALSGEFKLGGLYVVTSPT
jgi:hypothetical protein